MIKRLLILAVVIFLIYDAMVIGMLFEREYFTSWRLATEKPKNEESTASAQHFDSLFLVATTKIKTGLGTKSLVSDGKSVFVLNLEAMNIDVFDVKTKKHTARLSFVPTPAVGYDYTHKQPIHSYAEKPVEAAFSHGGRFVWISLHNAGGVVVWDRADLNLCADSLPNKKAVLQTDSGKFEIRLPFFKTGETPKYVVADKDLVFVSNWHSHTVSAIYTPTDSICKWKKIKDIAVGRVPRGMAIWQDTLWVGNMGQDYLSGITLDSLKVVAKQTVGFTPRHLLVVDTAMYVSLSSPEQIVRLSPSQKHWVKTCDDPRTLIQKAGVVFVACYGSGQIEAFDMSLGKLGNWKVSDFPVGLEAFTNEDVLELWVSHYKTGYLTVLTLQNHSPFYRQNEPYSAKVGKDGN